MTRERSFTARFARRLGIVNAWVDGQMDWLMWLLVLAAFFVRFRLASQFYLNGDEAQIMLGPLQHRLSHVFAMSAYLPYGPLMFLVLHAMAFFGRSELYFRMPSVIAGSLLVFVGYRWAAETFGKEAGFATGCILAFAPPLVTLSTEVRFYIVQALFMACSLYCLERALRAKSVAWMRGFGVALLLTVLTLYMSVWYVIAAGVYVTVWILWERPPKRLIVEWAITQTIIAGVFAIAYVTQLRAFSESSADRLARSTWLRTSYFHPNSESLWRYLWQATQALFQYIFANPEIGLAMIFVFLIGIVLLLWSKAGGRRLTALTLVLPLIVTAAAGTVSIYPYGGSRHDAFLVLFVAAAVSIAISMAAGGRALLVLLMAMCLLPLWLRSAQRNDLDDVPQVSKIGQMRSALDYLSSRTPRARVLMVDQRGAATINYYICGGIIHGWQKVAPKSDAYDCAGYQILTVDTWGAPATDFLSTLTRARKAKPGAFPEPVWVFDESGVWKRGHTVYNDDCARFGKIQVYRISPTSAASAGKP